MLHVGVCLPKSCTDLDVNRLVDTMLNSRIFGEKYYLDEQFSIVESKTLNLRENFFGTTMVNVFLYVFRDNPQQSAKCLRGNLLIFPFIADAFWC